MPYVVSPRGALDPYLRARSRPVKAIAGVLWQRRLLEGAAALHVTSDEEARLIDDVAPDVPRAVVPNGIRWAEFQDLPPAEEFRRAHLGGHEGPVVMYLGRLSHKKGLDVLVRAFAIVRRDAPDARLAIAGPDDEGLTPSLRALASREGVAGAVTFTGMLRGRDQLAALAAAAVWVLPSHSENFGIAAAEALAAGRAVIVSPNVNIAPEIAAAGAGVVSELTAEALRGGHRRAAARPCAARGAGRGGPRVRAPLRLGGRRPAPRGDVREGGGMSGDGITVIIPTRDEALHIARCVDSARALGPVFVVDCGSDDGTREIAATHGATVVQHAWEGHAGQKNWALDHLDIATEWVLFLDADEYLTDDAIAEMRAAIEDPDVAGWYVARRYVFLGKELKHAWWYPDYQLRLFQRRGARCENVQVHEHMIVDGPARPLRAAIMHENLKGLSAFVERHNRYSDLEAAEIVSPAADRKRGSFRGSWAERRRALKDRVWFRVPMRPLARFAWMYVVKRGFLDGRRGLLFCSLIAMYEFLIDAKLMERKLAAQAQHAPAPAQMEAQR